MKRIILSLCLALLSMAGFSQLGNGIENVILEKYYISDLNDYNGSTNHVPVGSTTYRIWVDLAPGWKLNAVYGNANHTLHFQTSTTFYNDGDYGSTTPNGFSAANLGKKTVMIDSWVSVGAAGNGRVAVQKSDDSDGAITNIHGLLQNNDPLAGIPISVKDGIISGSPVATTIVGITNQLDVLGDGTVTGSQVSINGGSWAALGGAIGTTAANFVLIAQITTDGDFSYDLNLSVQNTSTNVLENWVTNNPITGEFTAPFMHYAPNQKPIVSLTSPLNGDVFVTGDVVHMAADASDPDGTVDKVEFFVNGVKVGEDLTSPYTYDWTSTQGTKTLTAVATDNLGATKTSGAVVINVGANTPPTVTITSPSNGSTVKVGSTVIIAATASDPGGSVTQVEFFVNGSSVGIDNSAPYSVNWTATIGTANITAVATDNGGLTGTSGVVTISVVNNLPPAVSISAPLNNATYTQGNVVHIQANATDIDGTVTNVEFYVNGTKVGEDLTSPYQYDWTSTAGTKVLTAKATDNDLAVTTSGPITIDVADPNALPYKVQTTSNICTVNSFCLPLVKTAFPTPLANCIGFDVVLNYNKLKVNPTGIITIANNLITNPSYASYSSNIIDSLGQMNISVYLNASAPANTTFHGTGTLFCVQFSTLPAFQSIDTALFTVSSLRESYNTDVLAKQVEPGKYISYKDSVFVGSLKFWNGYEPMPYNVANPNEHLITQIFGSSDSATKYIPDLNGVFNYVITHGSAINIDRDILPSTDVMSVINGQDALLTKKVLIGDMSFIPNVFQMIAMDVNADGVVSAGDLSQINLRTILAIPEFKQAWNYSNTGVSNGKRSKDWLFVDNRMLDTAAYIISASYPANDFVGFSKYKVPVVDHFKPLPIYNANSCPLINDAIFQGILLGDVNGNYKNVASSGLIKGMQIVSDDNVIFNLGSASVSNEYVDVPVSVTSPNEIHALDFALNFNTDNYSFESIVNNSASIQSSSNFTAGDNTLRFTSYSLINYPIAQDLFIIRFKVKNPSSGLQLLPVDAFTNGEQSNATVVGSTSGINNHENNIHIGVHPNPVSTSLFVEVSEDASIQLIDVCGQVIISKTTVKANHSNEINVSGITNGIYFLKVLNGDSVTTRKIVVKH